MKKLIKKMTVTILALALALSGAIAQTAGSAGSAVTVYGAQKLIYLNKNYVNIVPGNAFKLNLYSGKKNISAKAKWTTSKKSVVKVNKKGRIKAKDTGKAVITATYGDKTYKCAVTSAYKDYEELYHDTLNAIYNRISGWGEESDALAGGFVGIAEFIGGDTGDAALKKIGYTIMDINGDAVPELIVTGITKRGPKQCFADDLCLIYTYSDKKSVEVISGWARNGYTLMDDGHLYYHGSNGAMYSMYGDFELEAGATGLVCRNFIFTSDEGNTNYDIEYYQNDSGFADVTTSTKITNGEFGKIWDSYIMKSRRIEVTPFSDFPVDIFSSVSEDIAVYNSTDGYEEYYKFAASESEYKVSFMVAANKTITDFKLYSLTWKDSAETIFTYELSEKPLYELEKLTSDKPLMLTVEFPGDMPAYAITFKDQNGTEKIYSLEQSGMDGSILLVDL